MSVYLSTNQKPGHQIATNTGWTDVGEWIESLDHAQFPDLVHLWEYGWNEPLSAVRDELSRAVKVRPAESSVASTLRKVASLLSVAPDSAPVVISHGEQQETEMNLSAAAYAQLIGRAATIHLSAADLHPSATSGLPSKSQSGEPLYHYWTDALKVGEWKLPKGGTLNVTPAMLAHIEKSTKLALSRGVEIPVCLDHKETADKVQGYVSDVKRDGDWLHVRHTFIGDSAKDMAMKNKVSLGLNPAYRDSFGNSYGWCVQHSALTGRPVIHGQKGFVPAA